MFWVWDNSPIPPLMKISSFTTTKNHFSSEIFINSGVRWSGYIGGSKTINQIVHILCAGAVVDLFVVRVDILDNEGKYLNIIFWDLGWSEQKLFDLVHWAGHGVQLGF